MKILLTAGGTCEPIDAVRKITNISSGRLGCLIKEEFENAGVEVIFLDASKGSAEDLRTKMNEAILKNGSEINAVIHSAAVSDYKVCKANTKIKLSSSSDELNLKLIRIPKIISGLRKKMPSSILVGFKLLANSSKKNLIFEGKELMKKNDLDFVIANDTSKLSEEKHIAYLISKENIETIKKVVGKKNIAKKITEIVIKNIKIKTQDGIIGENENRKKGE